MLDNVFLSSYPLSEKHCVMEGDVEPDVTDLGNLQEMKAARALLALAYADGTIDEEELLLFTFA